MYVYIYIYIYLFVYVDVYVYICRTSCSLAAAASSCRRSSRRRSPHELESCIHNILASSLVFRRRLATRRPGAYRRTVCRRPLRPQEARDSTLPYSLSSPPACSCPSAAGRRRRSPGRGRHHPSGGADTHAGGLTNVALLPDVGENNILEIRHLVKVIWPFSNQIFKLSNSSDVVCRVC